MYDKTLQSYLWILTHTHRYEKCIITVLSKGGNKKRNDPASYRAISLCSALFTLFEKVVLQIAEMDGSIHLNPSQGGFLKNVSCVMTAFMLRECV
jgi:hypothetical protein